MHGTISGTSLQWPGEARPGCDLRAPPFRLTVQFRQKPPGYSALAAKCRGRCLAEKQLVFDCKTPELPKAKPVAISVTVAVQAPRGAVPAERDACGAGADSALAPCPGAPGSTSAKCVPKPELLCISPGCRAVAPGCPLSPGETGASRWRVALAPNCFQRPLDDRGTPTMASINACSSPRAASGLAMISGASSARRPAAAWSRCSLRHRGRRGRNQQCITRRRQVATQPSPTSGRHLFHGQGHAAR